MSKNRIKVEAKDLDGNDVVIFAVRPTKEENTAAQLISNKMFKGALLAGALVRKTLEEELERQGIWSKEKQERLEGFHKEIREHLIAIKAGDIKLTEARDLAIKVRIARMGAVTLQSERNEYDSYTAEAQAEDAKINFLVAACLKNEKNEPYFKDADDYRENSDQPFAIEAAGHMVTMIYGVEEGWEADLPENKFLQKYKFVDDDLRLVNKDGDYVTVGGDKINADFQYVDDDNNVIDRDGNRLDDDGLPIVETMPFLDDDGNPIIDDVPKEDTPDESAPNESVE